MFDIKALVKSSQKIVVDNAPVILTGIGIAGTVATAVIAAKASFKAADLIRELETEVKEGQRANLTPDVTTKEKALLIWKLYIPAVGLGAATIVSIFYANKINAKRMAALFGAYTMTERAYNEYKDKVEEHVTGPKKQKIEEEIAQDRVNAHPVGNQQILVTGGGEVLCFDAISGRYFMSSMETLKQAQNDLNYQILSNDYVSLSDWYAQLALPSTKNSDDVGWNTDRRIELTPTTTMSDDGRPCIVVDFKDDPSPNYFRAH